jgi:hypothetical protein
MALLKAMGLGVLIFILNIAAPDVLSEGKKTVLAFLHGAQISATIASDLAASAGTGVERVRSLPAATPPFPLPQGPTVSRY